MEVLFENIAAYLFAVLLISLILLFYLLRHKRRSSINTTKIDKAKELGFHEPVSLHPVVDHDICIGSGACVAACPEKDILGMVNGQAQTINASRCVGHGACFHACPVQAITLCIGTETRGVELPHVSMEFETNIPGIFIAGELGGMGLIKNAVEQGRQAVENIVKKIKKSPAAGYDIAIIGAGPAGISATLNAVKHNLKYITLEQDNLGGTVFNFPRAKVVMTSAMDIPLHGKVKLSETSKTQLLDLWNSILGKYNIKINEQEKVESVERIKDYLFEITTSRGQYTASSVLFAIGRRGSPRKLGVAGEEKEKVYYRLLEPELIKNQKVLIAGGGDSAIESAMLLAEEGNEVTISYRSNSFSRLKPKNLEKLNKLVSSGEIKIQYNSNVKEIFDDRVLLEIADNDKPVELLNDIVYVFAGGELPTKFLEKTGITITKKFGDAVLKHNKK